MSICPRCSAVFGCGMTAPAAPGPCWCTTLPTLPADLLGSTAALCFCPDCLRYLIDHPAPPVSLEAHRVL
ncbi:cysteine-rich CWC family protein [Actimicrobium antarcticum]|uniref:cysteine-rich CWC family protein n=1 Tax=Actimicrobium antarcticum TaxID=1051899 RepID=UPI0031E0CC38